MARPLTRAQALENRAFLKLLRRTGNVRLACRELGLKYGTMQHRRSRHPAFAVRWDAALVFAQASFDKLRMSGRGGMRPRQGRALLRMSGALRDAGSTSSPAPRDERKLGGPSIAPSPRSRSRASRPSPAEGGGFRTVGGEAVVVRRNDGKLQMRRAQPGKLTREAEQGFLAALSATCNVRLAAAAVGASEAAFSRRRRKDPAFAREMRMALQRGYEQLEMALLESGVAGSHEHDDWRSNDPPAMPPMTCNQALQLMYLHQKEARLLAEPLLTRRRRGESREAQSFRLTAMYEERQRLKREEFEVAEALRWERGEPAWGPAGEAVRRELGLNDPSRRACGAPQDERSPFGLPDLAQVTGWSKADPAKAAHHPQRALFGGWRMEDLRNKVDPGSSPG